MPPVNNLRPYERPVGERVTALEITVAEGSKNLCEKFQGVREDITELNKKADTIDGRLDRIEMLIYQRTGMNAVLIWVLDIIKVVGGGVILWLIQHFIPGKA